jgi:hypothetical protein
MLLVEKPMTPTLAFVLPSTPCCESDLPTTAAMLEVLGTVGPGADENAEYAGGLAPHAHDATFAVESNAFDAVPVCRPSDDTVPVGRGADNAGGQSVRDRRLILADQTSVAVNAGAPARYARPRR